MKKIGRIIGVFVCVVGIVIIAGVLFIQKTFFEYDRHEVATVSNSSESVEQFIEKIGDDARQLAGENDLYASVLLAQAILESDKGRSALSSEPNFNLFGIKGQYKRNFVEYETLEDDGKGNMKTIVAKFRKYPSYKASMQDYVKLLRDGVSWDEQFYTGVYKSNTSTYQDATAFLTGTYATDSRYEEKLNDLIEQYDLQQYDSVNE